MANKILCLGDTHGRTLWKEIIEKEHPDLIIFLGDYVSTHGLETADEQFHNLCAILRFKEEWGDKCILLRGNHDTQHLGYSWAECSGWNQEVYGKMQTIKKTFLDKTQWIYPLQLDDKFIIFSHAGISNTWYSMIQKRHPKIACIADINQLKPSEDFGFIPNSPFDYSGDSVTQPCTWIRPGTLITDMPEGVIQVVGHTPIKGECLNLTEEIRKKKAESEEIKKIPDLWLCDAIGNRSYLVIEDGQFIPKTL